MKTAEKGSNHALPLDDKIRSTVLARLLNDQLLRLWAALWDRSLATPVLCHALEGSLALPWARSLRLWHFTGRRPVRSDRWQGFRSSCRRSGLLEVLSV